MPGLQEYVIRLSADVDNMGVQNLMSILDKNKVKALGLTAALTAATTAVYKWVESATKQEMELDKLAKKQKKSIEQTRAEQEALKQMGMTLDEIKKDKALKEIYDDLVKFNQEMQMPNAANMLGKVRELQSAFWKLKSAVNYLVQSIGAQLLINLEKPIERITNTLGKGANWLKNNLTSIGTKITGYLTAFAKGVIGIAEGVGKIFNWLGQMPEGIKSIAGTIATVFALIKSGPIGQIMALITAAGDLIHDYENSQWNKENRENTKLWNDGKGGYTDTPTEFGAYQVPLAYENLWNFLENDPGTLREKAKTITSSVLEGIKDALDGFSDTLNSGEGLTEWLETLTGPIGDILGGIQDALGGKDGQQQIAGIITKFFTVAASLCKEGGAFGAQIIKAVGGLIASVFGMEDIWNDSNVKEMLGGENGFANGLVTAIETALLGGNFIESALTGVLSGWQTERSKALKGLYQQDHADEGIDWEKVVWGKDGMPSYTELEAMYGQDSRLGENIGEGLQGSFNTFISGILEMLVGGINIASDVAGNVLNMIIQAVIQGILAPGNQGISDNVANALNSEGAKDVVDAVGAGIGTWIMSGNFFAGILGSVVSFVSQSIETAKTTNTPLWDVMKEKVSDFWDSIQDIIYGPIIEGKYNADGTQKRDRQYGLASVIEPLLWGEMKTVGESVENVLEAAEDKVTGKKYWARKGGILNWLLGYDTTEVGTGEKFRVKGIFEKAWEGADGEGGIKGFFTGLADKIVSWLEPVGDAILNWATGVMDNLWIAMFNGMPDWLKTGIEILLGKPINNPNKSKIAQDAEGNYYIESTNGEKLAISPEQAKTLSTTNEFMDNLEGHTLLDQVYVENGQLYGNDKSTYRGTPLLDENGQFTDLAATWFGTREYWNNFEDWKKETEAAIEAKRRREQAEAERKQEETRRIAEEAERRRAEAAANAQEPEAPTRASDEEIAAAEKNLVDLLREHSSMEIEDMDDGTTTYQIDHLPSDDQARLDIEDAFYAWYQATGRQPGGKWSYDRFGNVVYNPNAQEPEAPDYSEYVPEDYNGNVDLLNRKEIPTSDLTSAGWTDEDGGPVKGDYATVFSQTYSMGDKSKGYDFSSKENQVVTFTPIQANGAVVSPEILERYVEKLAEQSSKTGKTVKELDASGIKIDGSLLQGLLLHSSSVGSGETLKAAYDREGSWAVNLHDLQAKLSQAKVSVKVPVKTTGESAAAAEGANKMQSAANGHTILYPTGTKDGDGTPTNEAMGGRFDKPFEARVAEAGAEYIIPVTKRERAFSLILQALSEMGGDMIKRVTDHFGGSLSEGVYDMASGMAARVGKDFALGTSGTVGGSLGGIESALQNMQQNFNYNISAPVSIQVQSSGASAQEIGTAVYDAAERHLLKTLRGAYA